MEPSDEKPAGAVRSVARKILPVRTRQFLGRNAVKLQRNAARLARELNRRDPAETQVAQKSFVAKANGDLTKANGEHLGRDTLEAAVQSIHGISPRSVRLPQRSDLRPIIVHALKVARKVYHVSSRATQFKRNSRAAKALAKELRRDTAEMALKSACAVLPRPTRLPRPSDVRQIVLFGDMGIGNFIMFTPLLWTLRKHFKFAEIVVVFLKPRGAEIVAERCAAIDRIEVAANMGILATFRHLRKKGIAPDLVVSRWSGNAYQAFIIALLRPRWRVGHVTSAGFVGYCDRVFNFAVRMDIKDHEVERNLDLARTLDIDKLDLRLDFPLRAEDRKKAESIAYEFGISFDKLVCLQAGSSKLQNWKRWPTPYWQELAIALRGLGYQIALVGSKDERDVAEQVLRANALKDDAGVFDLCGVGTLHTTGAIIARSLVLVCNDSGLMHIAAALQTPIVSIFGPTEYERTKPYTTNAVVVRAPCHCNHGTLFSRETQKKIAECDGLCLKEIASKAIVRAVQSICEPAGEPDVKASGASA